MFESFRKRRYGVRLAVRELYLVTEYRAGSVFKTRRIGLVAGSEAYFNTLQGINPNIIVASVPTRVSLA